MANRIVAEVISNDVDTIVLVADDYAIAFVRYPTEYFHEFGWGDIWYNILTEPDFDDLFDHVKADHAKCEVIVDDDGLPVLANEDDDAAPHFGIIE